MYLLVSADLLIFEVHLHSLGLLASVHVLQLLETKGYFLRCTELIPWLLLVDATDTVHSFDFLLKHPDSLLLKVHCIIQTRDHLLLRGLQATLFLVQYRANEVLHLP